MDRRTFTLGLLTATSLAGLSTRVSAQGAMPTAQYLPMANKGSMFLEETARTAFDKTQNPAVKRFARAEVVEQVNLEGKIAARTGVVTGGPAAAPGGLVGAAVAAPFAVAGAAVGTAGAIVGGALGPMTSDAQKAQFVAQIRDMPPGPGFDAAFVNAQLMGHQEALALHGTYAQSGDDPVLRRVARGALPLIRLHISQLTRMQRMMGGPVG